MATSITRWDPANDIASMRSMMDRLFEGSFGRFPAFRPSEELGGAGLGLDVFETNDALVVKAAIPGVNPQDLDIAVEEDVLTIKGEFKQEETSDENQYHRRELRYGSFERSLRLPPTVDPEKAEATFEHGMLKLEIPKKPEAKARSIKITPKGVVNGGGAESGTA